MPKTIFPASGRKELARLFELKIFPLDPEFWSIENCSKSADRIITKWKNPSTAMRHLAGFRNFLREIGKDDEHIKATFRPDVCILANNIGEASRKRRIAKGIEVPDRFLFGALTDRVHGYLDNQSPCSSDMAADFVVALCCRRTECETLQPVGDGMVVGALKTRSETPIQFKIHSCLPDDLASKFLVYWDSIPITTRKEVMRTLSDVTREWGLQVRDLRAIGAFLASRSASNIGNHVESMTDALRHKRTAGQVSSFMPYARVLDPNRDLFSAIEALSPEQIARLKEFVVLL